MFAVGVGSWQNPSVLLEEACGLPHLKEKKKKVGINALRNVGLRLSLN